MKYSILVASLAGTALAAPMPNNIDKRQLDGLTGGLTNTVGGLTGGLTGGQKGKDGKAGGALDGVTDTVGGLTGGLTGGDKGKDGKKGGALGGATDAVGGLGNTVGGLTGSLTGGAGGKGGLLGNGLLGGSLIPGILKEKREVGGAETFEGETADYVDIQNDKAKRQLDAVTGLVGGLTGGLTGGSGGKKGGLLGGALIPGILKRQEPLSPEDIAMLGGGDLNMQKRQLDGVTDAVGGLTGGLTGGAGGKGGLLGGALIPGILKREEPLSPEDIAMLTGTPEMQKRQLDAVTGLAGGLLGGGGGKKGGLLGGALIPGILKEKRQLGGVTDAVGGLTGGLTGGNGGGAGGLLGGALIPGILKRSEPLSPGAIDTIIKGGTVKAKRQLDAVTGLAGGLLGGGGGGKKGGLLGGALIPGLLKLSEPLSPEDIATLQANDGGMKKRQLGGVTDTVGGLTGGLTGGLLGGGGGKKGGLLGGALIPGILKREEPLSPEDIAMLGGAGAGS